MLDILIKNGNVIDGTGKAAKKLDVGIRDGKIVDLAENIQEQADKTIDAQSKFVAPGFIDIQNHSDSYWTLFDQPDQTSLLSQGITSIVVGNCGASLAPLLSKESIKAIQKWHSLSGVNVDWLTMTELLTALGKLRLGVNVATLVGHSTLRRGLIGDQIKTLSRDEIKALSNCLRDSLDQGAFGLSMGLVYAHEVDSSTDELLQLTKDLKSDNKYLSVHLRSETDRILESIDEVIDLARESGVAVKIAHLKIRGKDNWRLFDEMINKLETAYHEGLKISFDVYPYDSSWAVLYTYLPKWAYEGGRSKILEHFKVPSMRKKVLDFLKGQEVRYEKIIIAEAAGNKSLVGKSLADIAASQNITGGEVLINVIAATNAQVVVFDHNLSTEHVDLLCASPLSMIATDGSGYSGHTSTLVHPRCFGTMPKFLKMVREKKILKWEKAIQKITTEPTILLGINNRGQIAKNYAADVLVFDPRSVTDKADYQNPDILSEGIEKVIVNGRICFSDNKAVDLAGKVLRR